MKRNALVLIVAADALTRQLTRNGLETYGHEVVTARDGAEAMALLETERRIGVVVTDVDLGGGPDGLLVAEAARRADSRMLVIYTARFPQTVPAARKVPGAPILRTPFHPQQVLGVIAQMRQSGGEATAEAA